IPGADLRSGLFDSTDFEEADLSEVNFSKAWLRQANLSKTRMEGDQFEELPYLQLGVQVWGCAFSSDGRFLAVSTSVFRISIHDTKTRKRIAHYLGGYAIAISPVDHELAKESLDNTVELGDILTDVSRIVLSGHADEVTCISYSPDGTQIATSSEDDTVRIWSTLSGYVFGVNCVAYSPTGQYIASAGTDKTVRLWTAGGGGLEDPGSGRDFDRIKCIDISPDCSRIVTGRDDGTIQLWETLPGRQGAIITGHTDFVWDVKFSPCGNRIASASANCTVRLWCVQTGTPLRVLGGQTHHVQSLAFSPNGHQLIFGSGNIVQTWNTQTGEPGFSLRGHTNKVNEVAYSPNALQVASCSNDLTVRLWCSRTGEQLHAMTLLMTVSRLAYSPDGQHLISGSFGGGLSYWNTQSGAHDSRLAAITYRIYAYSFSPDGKLIATSTMDNMLRLWDIGSGGCVEVYRSMIGLTSSIKWKQGPDCMYLANITRTGSIRVWRLLEIEGMYMVHLVWGTGFNELSLVGATMDDVVGLSPANLALLKQRAIC
ncbi:hypothetical protein BGX29_008066, partial [Mortierella sp. GBA35]